MTEITALDRAHARMAAAPEEDAARLRFLERVADAELFLLLESEPAEDRASPRLFPLEDGPIVLAFDLEERLAAFTGAPAPYLALPGRALVSMLTGQGLGLGLNLTVAPSEFILPAEGVAWLAETLTVAPEAGAARPEGFEPPARAGATLIAALDEKLALAAGMARRAHLAGVRYSDGSEALLLAFEAAEAGAEAALAKAVAEAVAFSGDDGPHLDVTFLAEDDPALAMLGRVALAFVLPEPAAETAQVLSPSAPGTDPARPPKLR